MTSKLLLTTGSVATAVTASMVLFATPAMAQNTCDLDGTDAGNNATCANASGAVAVGARSVANEANTASAGNVGTERGIVNVATGTAATDAVNIVQLNPAVAGASGAAAAA